MSKDKVCGWLKILHSLRNHCSNRRGNSSRLPTNLLRILNITLHSRSKALIKNPLPLLTLFRHFPFFIAWRAKEVEAPVRIGPPGYHMTFYVMEREWPFAWGWVGWGGIGDEACAEEGGEGV